MSFVGGRVAAAILSRYEWHDIEAPPGYVGAGKLEALFDPTIWEQVAGKVVLDFGCGIGDEALEIACHGAKQVIGLDIREDFLAIARSRQADAHVSNCTFVRNLDAQADVIFSVDSFEHFDNPGEILSEMARLLSPGQGYCFVRSPVVSPEGRPLSPVHLGACATH